MHKCPQCGESRLKTRDPEQATYVVNSVAVCQLLCWLARSQPSDRYITVARDYPNPNQLLLAL